MAVLAVQAIRRMRGGAQSQLMLGADGKLWVVKFQNNPQDVRVLANELIATRLAAAVGLTVPVSDVVEVTDWLVANTLWTNTLESVVGLALISLGLPVYFWQRKSRAPLCDEGGLPRT